MCTALKELRGRIRETNDAYLQHISEMPEQAAKGLGFWDNFMVLKTRFENSNLALALMDEEDDVALGELIKTQLGDVMTYHEMCNKVATISKLLIENHGSISNS